MTTITFDVPKSREKDSIMALL